MASTQDTNPPVTEETLERLPGKLTPVTVRTEVDGRPYIVTGRYVGLIHDPDGVTLRVVPEDRIERRLRLPAAVTVRL